MLSFFSLLASLFSLRWLRWLHGKRKNIAVASAEGCFVLRGGALVSNGGSSNRRLRIGKANTKTGRITSEQRNV